MRKDSMESAGKRSPRGLGENVLCARMLEKAAAVSKEHSLAAASQTERLFLGWVSANIHKYSLKHQLECVREAGRGLTTVSGSANPSLSLMPTSLGITRQGSTVTLMVKVPWPHGLGSLGSTTHPGGRWAQ